MNAAAVMEQFSALPTRQKFAGLGVIMAGLAAAFYFLLYSGLADEADAVERQLATLRQEKEGYEEKKRKYMAFRAEVKKLLAEKKELLKVLPTRAEIPSLLQSLHSQAELSGLNILTFDRQDDVVKDFYAEIPVRMVISGSYHQINRFFYAIGNLKRIVNIQDVLLSDPERTSQGVVLKAKFVTSTFRFISKPAPAAAAGGHG